MVSAANSAARKQRAGQASRDAGAGPPENGSAAGGKRRPGPDGQPPGKKSANGKQSAEKGTTAAESAEAPEAQEMETWVQDTAESELAIDSLDHPADLDAVVDIAVVDDVEVDVDVEIDEAHAEQRNGLLWISLPVRKKS